MGHGQPSRTQTPQGRCQNRWEWMDEPVEDRDTSLGPRYLTDTYDYGKKTHSVATDARCKGEDSPLGA
jgi:hypothetical protein